jgi:hypothetical protein
MLDKHGIRRVTDEGGLVWEVWEAHPRLLERRRIRDRRATLRPGGADRRRSEIDLRLLKPDTAGWLVFRSGHDERRRSPIPPGWETMPAHGLLDILHHARNTAPFPRQRL